MTAHGLILQLADSAFPVGGFAHSAGLEAAVQSGWVRDRESLENYCMESLRQAGALSLSFVRAAHRDGRRLDELDARSDVLLSNAIANRASRTQGRAHFDTCARVFGERVARLPVGPKLHHAPVFGATLAAIDVDELDAARIFLHLALRGVTSAAVRLGALGPTEAQRLHFRAHATCEEVLARSHANVDDAAQISPIADLLQSTHDRLYSRLFQS